MGNYNTKLTKEDVHFLKNNTELDEHAIRVNEILLRNTYLPVSLSLTWTNKIFMKFCKVWHSDFLDSFPTGLVSQADFISLHHILYPSGDPSNICEHTFRTFDCNGDGRIDFRWD